MEQGLISGQKLQQQAYCWILLTKLELLCKLFNQIIRNTETKKKIL